MVFLIEGQFIRFMYFQFIFSIYRSIDFISMVVFLVLEKTSVLALLNQKLTVSHTHTHMYQYCIGDDKCAGFTLSEVSCTTQTHVSVL